ncbi:MAG TPA: hypothetical protein VNJ29_00695 [Candidatus Nitrosotenuis sp.]|jgi:hypothetical protein|nr:hypothetical protein [Candidatus Nitrosotenuis sp.]
MIALILMTLIATAPNPQAPRCLTKLDPCCQNCLQRYRVCDWRHSSLQKDANCLHYVQLCMDRCKILEKIPEQKQMSKVPPIDSSQQ